MAVHQTARFLVNTMRSHELAIVHIGCYHCNSCEHGIIYKTNIAKCKEVYIDAELSGCWSSADAVNADNVLSQTDFFNVMLTVLWSGAASCR